MRVALYIDGRLIDKVKCDFIYSPPRGVRAMKNVIDRFKIRYESELKEAERWEVFLYQKSKI